MASRRVNVALRLERLGLRQAGSGRLCEGIPLPLHESCAGHPPTQTLAFPLASLAISLILAIHARVPCAAFMQGQRDAPHNPHAGAGGCPAQPSCRGRGMPRTAFTHGQGDAQPNLYVGQGMPRKATMQRWGDVAHSLHAGSGGCPAQPSRRGKGMLCTVLFVSLPGRNDCFPDDGASFQERPPGGEVLSNLP